MFATLNQHVWLVYVEVYRLLPVPIETGKSHIPRQAVGAGAGLAFGTGVCFSTWLAVVHSASLAGSFLYLLRTRLFNTCSATAALCAASSNPLVAGTSVAS